MTFSTRNFDRLSPLAPKFPNFAIQILLFRLKHTAPVVTNPHVLQNFYTALVRAMGCCFPKTTFRTKIGGGLGSIKKFGTPTYFYIKFGTQLAFGTTLPKTTLRTKIAGGLGQGSIQRKFGTPYLFLQLLKLATEKLVHNMSSGLPCQQVLEPN